MRGWRALGRAARALVTAGLLAGCAGPDSGTLDGTSAGDDDDDDVVTGDDDDDTTDPPATEKKCDDEVDNDDDGLLDCEDDDCDGEQLCMWPVGMQFDSRLDFDANTLAELAGYSDCRVVLTANLQRDRAESCDGCDRVFTGPFQFTEDDCPPDFERPDQGSYGVAFVAPDRWEIFGRVEDQWGSLGMAQDDGSGTLKIQDTSPVEVDGLEVGSLTSLFSFTP